MPKSVPRPALQLHLSSFEAAPTGSGSGSTNLTTQATWSGNRYTLDQKFLFPGTMDQATLLKKLDASMRAFTTAAAPGSSWSGGDLKLGFVTIVSLSSPHLTTDGNSMVYARDIKGGMLAGAPGGQLLFKTTQTPQGILVDAELTGFQPRLPKAVYLATQEPAHRLVVQQAVQAVFNALSGN